MYSANTIRIEKLKWSSPPSYTACGALMCDRGIRWLLSARSGGASFHVHSCGSFCPLPSYRATISDVLLMDALHNFIRHTHFVIVQASCVASDHQYKYCVITRLMAFLCYDRRKNHKLTHTHNMEMKVILHHYVDMDLVMMIIRNKILSHKY